MNLCDKNSLKRDAGVICWLLLLGQVFMQGAAMLASVIGILFGIEQAMLIGSDIGSFIANFIILGIFWLVRRKEISLPSGRSGHPFKLTALAFTAVVFINGMVSSLDYATNQMFSIPLNSSGESVPLVTNLLLVAVFPAIVEEFAFRKVLFGVMRKHGFGVAAVFSSLMFALMHQNFIQLIFAFGMGLILCKLYECTGRLIYCMLVHFLNNAYSVLMGAVPLSADIMKFIEIAIGIIGIIVLIICIYTKKFNLKRFLNYENELPAKIGVCFGKISVIIFTAFCLIMCVAIIFI